MKVLGVSLGSRLPVWTPFLCFCLHARVCACMHARSCACLCSSKTAWISVDVQFASPAQNDSPREFRLQYPSLKVGGRTYASKHQKSNYVGLPRARVFTLTFDFYSGSLKKSHVQLGSLLFVVIFKDARSCQ